MINAQEILGLLEEMDSDDIPLDPGTKGFKVNIFDNPGLAKVDAMINRLKVLSQIEVPSFLYHVTQKSKVFQIKNHGLRSGKMRVDDTGETGNRIYLTNDIYGIADSPGYEGLKLQAIQVSTKGLKLRLDPEYNRDLSIAKVIKFANTKPGPGGGLYMYTTKVIPKSKIMGIFDLAKAPLPKL